MGAAPAAGGAAAVRCFGDGEIADGVVDHYCTGTQTLRDSFPSAGIAGPDTGRECERRIVRAGDGFFRVAHRLDREDGAEGFLLKKLHGRIDVGDNRGLEEIWAEIDARMSAAENSCATTDRIFDEIDHALDVMRANHGTDIGIGVTAGT